MISDSDRLEIMDLMVRYSNLIDERCFSRFDEVFTQDCLYDLDGVQLGVLRGKAEIDHFLRTGWHPLMHINVNLEIFPETADRVRAFSRCLAALDTGLTSIATYRDVLVRTAAGWRIAERVVTLRTKDAIPSPS